MLLENVSKGLDPANNTLMTMNNPKNSSMNYFTCINVCKFGASTYRE